jgi:CO/xanthine dehydrogenase FAD-binding subunit
MRESCVGMRTIDVAAAITQHANAFTQAAFGELRVKPSLFGYARAESVEDALSLLAQGDGETRVLAGGQSLVPLLNLRMARVSALIDVNGLSELSFITREDGMLRVGALTRHRHLEVSEGALGAAAAFASGR